MICNSGKPEGDICANNGEYNEAYCSYDIGSNACAYCYHKIPTMSPTKSLLPSISDLPSTNPTEFTIAPTFSPCEDSEINVQIRIITDNKPYEISWELHYTDSSGRLGKYINLHQYTKIFHEYNHQLCLPAESCFAFKIKDAYGDGIDAPGGYEITVDSTILASAIHETIAGFNYDDDIVQNCQPTINPTTSPTLSPSHSPCDKSEITVVITIQTDNYPDEISWRLIDIETGSLLVQSSDYTIEAHSYQHQQCLSATSCNIFTIHDSYGDGIILPGGYQVFVDDTIVASSFGSSGSFNSHTEFVRFGNRCAPSRSPTVSPSMIPSLYPSISFIPSVNPTALPSSSPSISFAPSANPTTTSSLSPILCPRNTDSHGIVYRYLPIHILTHVYATIWYQC